MLKFLERIDAAVPVERIRQKPQIVLTYSIEDWGSGQRLYSSRMSIQQWPGLLCLAQVS